MAEAKAILRTELASVELSLTPEEARNLRDYLGARPGTEGWSGSIYTSLSALILGDTDDLEW